MPVFGAGLPNPKGLQLWIDLPRQHKMAVRVATYPVSRTVKLTSSPLIATVLPRVDPRQDSERLPRRQGWSF